MSSQEAGPRAVMDESHGAWAEFVRGNSERAKPLFSNQDDVSLGNPFGSFVRGWKEAEATMDRAAASYREGEVVGFETVSTYSAGELASVSDDLLTVELTDGRRISAPTSWYPRLAQASSSERSKLALDRSRDGIHWVDLDEDISVEGLLEGRRSG